MLIPSFSGRPAAPMRTACRALSVATLLSASLAAQAPVTGTLVKDVNVGPPSRAVGSGPFLLAAGGGVAWFSAESAEAGREAWVTDGTPAGTRMVGDLTAGPDSSGPSGGVVLPSGAMVFSATADGVGAEPHVVMPGGGNAQVLVDLEAGPASSSPTRSVLWNGEAWFAATTTARGMELWRTDGTAAGTREGGDILAGPDSVGIDGFRMHVAGNKLFFVGGQFANHLWVKSGPAAAPRRLVPMSLSFRTYRWYGVEVNGKLMFPVAANGFGEEPEPWVTDGTMAGSMMLGDLMPGPSGSDVRILASDGQRVFFSALSPGFGRELWVTDGTPAGTRQVVDLNIGAGSGVSETGGGALLPNGDVVFSGSDGAARGGELWRSDGTPAGTRLIADLAVGPDSSWPSRIHYFSGAIWFEATSANEGRELWRYDPVSGVVERMTDLSPGTRSSATDTLAELQNGKTLFVGIDPFHGLEPRAIGTTPGSDELLADVHVDDNADSNPRLLMRHRDLAIYQASDGVHGSEPFVTDGTEAGTHMLLDIEPGFASSFPIPLASLPQGLVFTALRGRDRVAELWVTDGTTSGTHLLTALGTEDNFEPVFAAQKLGDRLIFAAGDANFSAVLWVTDGTVQGTQTIDGWTELYDVELRATSAGRVFGTVQREQGNEELLVTDGTPAGTSVTDIWPGSRGSFPVRFGAVPDGVVFTPFEPVEGVELWFAGGNPLRVERLTTSMAGTGGLRVNAIASLENFAVLTVQDPLTLEYDFWRSDGTVAGTVPFAPGLPAQLANRAAGLQAAGGQVFFWSRPGPSPFAQLWVTDGTTSGTRFVSDSAGVNSYYLASEMLPVGDGLHVVFQQNNLTYGNELWISDGTTAGTRPLTDTAVGTADSFPEFVVRVGNRLLFQADDARSGIELHAVDLAATGAYVASVFGTGCGASLQTGGAPVLGGQLDLEVGTGPGAAIALLFAERRAHETLAVGCELHLTQPVSIASALADPTGTGRLTVPVPNDAALVGTLLHFQAFANVAGGPLLGALEGTPGLEVVVGR